MLKVGITGGIGAGKTTVCKIFEHLGIPIYYADVEAKILMTYDKSLKKAIKQLLGNSAYHQNGRLNRKVVAKKVFADKELLEKLNLLVHPAVGIHANHWFNTLPSKTPYGIKEAALLVENGSYKNLDYLISVSASMDKRIQRVMKRDKVTKEQVLSRMKNQLAQEEKDQVADFVINNDGDQSLVKQVWSIHQALLKAKN